MKKNKLLLEIEGISIIERVITAAVHSNLDEVLLIYRDKSVKKIADNYPIIPIVNEMAYKGQSESIKSGVKNSHEKTDAYLFLVGDQPFLSSEIIDLIIHSYQVTRKNIIVPLYKGNRGNPVLFSSQYKEKLLALEGDIGGRQIIEFERKNVHFEPFDELKEGLDIDTWDEYIRYC